jgi:hypothetical protein
MYQLIDSMESLQPPPPPTPHPRWVCTGSGISIESAPLEGTEAHHGGDICVVCCVDALILVPTKISSEGGVLSIPSQTKIGVKLLTGSSYQNGCQRAMGGGRGRDGCRVIVGVCVRSEL